ncbi:MAG: pyridoxamine 5'-phosphate oxidase family protein [Kiloniellales bacterium]|nr:pyridoxamine 5'-phosphate oxidase family protein [Kiloniellales bacterium]
MTQQDEIRDPEALRAHLGEPSDLVRRKKLRRLDRHCRRFIALSPFLVLSTADAEGTCDASPRGDAPGFVSVLDDGRLLIPERRGNKLADSLLNILANPRVGLIFLIPGVEESLRVNGRAGLTRDPALLAPLAAQGKAPEAGILVEVEEAFLHCGKALIRARLWDPGARIPRDSLPSLGRMIADQVSGYDSEETEAHVQESYRKRLY